MYYSRRIITLALTLVLALAGSAFAQAEADHEFTLGTGFIEGKFVFIGVGGDIDGVINPGLEVSENSTVSVTLVNSDAMEHDFAIGELGVFSESVFNPGESTTVTFEVGASGSYQYWCTIPGHRQIGMEGSFIVGSPVAEPEFDVPSLAKDPADIPGPIGDRGPTTIDLDLVTTERLGRLADASVKLAQIGLRIVQGGDNRKLHGSASRLGEYCHRNTLLAGVQCLPARPFSHTQEDHYALEETWPHL